MRTSSFAATSTHYPYPILTFIRFRRVVGYLSNPSVQAALGVDPAVRGNFSFSSASVARAFDASLDWYNFPATDYIAALLERGVRALIFAGEDDWICNWVRASHRHVSIRALHLTAPLRVDWQREDDDGAGVVEAGRVPA